MRLWRYLYGENPLHLLSVLACFALVGYVVSIVYTDASAWYLLVWFVGAALVHDLVMFPLYALADQPLVLTRWVRRRALPSRPPAVPAINHVRLPALGAAVLGLIYLPTITAHAADSFAFAAGHPLADEYGNWLGITGLLFLVSAVVYALRLGAAAGRGVLRRRTAPTPPSAEPRAAASEPAEPAAEGEGAEAAPTAERAREPEAAEPEPAAAQETGDVEKPS